MTVHLQYKGGANWRVKKPSLISISKAPGALLRKNTVFVACSMVVFTVKPTISVVITAPAHECATWMSMMYPALL